MFNKKNILTLTTIALTTNFVSAEVTQQTRKENFFSKNKTVLISTGACAATGAAAFLATYFIKQNEIKNLTNLKRRLNGDLDISYERFDDLAKQKKELLQGKASLEERVLNLKTKLSGSTEDINNLNKKINDTAKELEATQKQLEKTKEADAEKINQIIRDLEKRMAEVINEKEVETAKIAQLLQEKASLEKTMSDLENGVTFKDSEIELVAQNYENCLKEIGKIFQDKKKTELTDEEISKAMDLLKTVSANDKTKKMYTLDILASIKFANKLHSNAEFVNTAAKICALLKDEPVEKAKKEELNCVTDLDTTLKQKENDQYEIYYLLKKLQKARNSKKN